MLGSVRNYVPEVKGVGTEKGSRTGQLRRRHTENAHLGTLENLTGPPREHGTWEGGASIGGREGVSRGRDGGSPPSPFLKIELKGGRERERKSINVIDCLPHSPRG